MQKDFRKWSVLKKQIHETDEHVFAHPREFWWCSMGLNIGAETDGKNENFERPVIVMKVYNRETLLVLPITSKQKDDQFHYKIQTSHKIICAKLTQSRVINSKRLLRKVDVLGEAEFESLKEIWKASL
jgi:mRNA interferase MazF